MNKPYRIVAWLPGVVGEQTERTLADESMHVVRAAVGLAASTQGEVEVIALAVGEILADSLLHEAISAGASRALRVAGAGLSRDPIVGERTLGPVIASLNADVVLTASHPDVAGGYELAATLGWNIATGVVDVTSAPAEGLIRVVQAEESGDRIAVNLSTPVICIVSETLAVDAMAVLPTGRTSDLTTLVEVADLGAFTDVAAIAASVDQQYGVLDDAEIEPHVRLKRKRWVSALLGQDAATRSAALLAARSGREALRERGEFAFATSDDPQISAARVVKFLADRHLV